MSPTLSVVVVFHNMRREAPRTLFSLSPAYQRDVKADEYEVIAIDNASQEPLDGAKVQHYGVNFRYLFHASPSKSPVGAVNRGVAEARGDYVVVCIDGARMLSPGVLRYSLMAFRAFSSPFVYTLGWHLGDEPQNVSMTKGYCQAIEDQLLETVAWERNGYALFSISSLAPSSKGGWFSSISESSCFALSKRAFLALGGLDAGFQSPGGGLANLDFFARACEAPDLLPVVLLGEGSFHQFHGGVATNVPMAEHPWKRFHGEYRRIRGRFYTMPTYDPHYLGHIPPEARRFLPVTPARDP